MGELGGVLLALAIVLGLVTLVGHGLWVLLTWMFGGRSGRSTTSSVALQRRTCPRCLTPRDASPLCHVCNWPDPLPVGDRRVEVLRAIRMQLAQYYRLGVITQATRRSITAAIDAAAPADPAVASAATAPAAASDQPRETLGELAEVEVVAKAAGQRDDRADAISPFDQEDEEDAAATPALSPTAASDGAAAPGERVRHYVERRRAAGVAMNQAPAPAAAPAPKERFSKLFASFLEEKNVRWGELVGGLLIVCCSIALVISFWAEIANRPLLKFCVFNGVVAALFGAGFYAERHWKLQMTSRGLLIIAILLVPLNFLAIAAFTDKSPPTDALSLGGEAASLALFTALVYVASRIVTPASPLLAVVGVMLPSVMQLLIRRFAGPQSSPGELYALAGVPIATYLGVSSLNLRPLIRQQRPLNEPAANQLFVFLGLATFAVALPLALLLHKTQSVAGTLQRLAPLAVLCGAPALAAGLLFWRRRDDQRLGGLQTAGFAVGIAGALVMLGALALAWPDPATMLPTAIVNAAAFALIAWWCHIAEAHVVAAICGAIACLISLHLLRGDLTWNLQSYQPLARSLLTATSGNMLAPLAAAYLAVAWLWSRNGRRADALWWAVSAALVATASLALILVFGFGRAGDPFGVTWTLLAFTAAAAVAAVKLPRQEAAWAAAALLLLTLLQAVVFRYSARLELAQPWAAALLLHAALSIVAVVAVRRRMSAAASVLETAWLQAAVATSCAALALVLLRSPYLPWQSLSLYLLAVAVAWLLLSALAAWRPLFPAFQFALLAALWCGVTAVLETYPWYQAAPRPWLDPWFLQAQGAALALFTLAWTGLVRTSGKVKTARPNAGFRQPLASNLAELIQSPPLEVIDGVRVLVVLLLVMLSIYAVTPGVGQELAPLERSGLANRVVPPVANFELADVPHEHAAGPGAWILVGAAAIMLVASLWVGVSPAASAVGLLLTAGASCLIAATWWSADVSVASAVRWLLAGLYCAGSAVVWNRERLGQRIGLRASPNSDEASIRPDRLDAVQAHRVLAVLAAAPYIAMAGYVGVAALAGAGTASVPAWLFQLTAVVFALGALAALDVQRLGASNPPSITLVGREKIDSFSPWSQYGASVLTVFATAPLLVCVAFAVAAALKLHPLAGPESGAWFREIGWSVSYGAPLFAIALTLLGSGIRERSQPYVFTTGLLLNVIATLVYLLEIAKAGRGLDGSAWVQLAQVNGIVSSIFALAWLAAISWGAKRGAVARPVPGLQRSVPGMLIAQTAIVAALAALALAPAVVGLFLEPAVWLWVATAGGRLGVIATALSMAVILATARFGGFAIWQTVERRGWLVVTAAAIVSLVAASRDTGNLLGYRTLIVSSFAAAWIMSFAAWKSAAPSMVYSGASLAAAIRWSELLTWIAIVVTLRALPVDRNVWWPIAGLATIAALATRLGWLAGRRRFVWLAGLLLNVTASIWWTYVGARITASSGEVAALVWCYLNVTVAAAWSVASVVIERLRIVPALASRPARQIAGYHRVATWLALSFMFAVTVFSLASDLSQTPLYMNVWWSGVTLAGLAAAATACFWDHKVRFTLQRLYGVGLLAVAMFLDSLDASGLQFVWSLTLALAAFALATSYLWSQRAAIRSRAIAWGLPMKRQDLSPASYQGQGWLVAANGLLAIAVTTLVFLIEFTFEAHAQRIVAAYAVLAAALAVALLAKGDIRSPLQYAALVFGVLFALAFAWSWLPIPMEAALLHRTVAAAVALIVVTPLYGFGIVKLIRRKNEWTKAAQRLTPLAAAIPAALLLVVLGIEAYMYAAEGAVPIRLPALVAVVLGLAGLVVAALAAALLPGRDPLGLTERGRTVYVYAAEGLLALLFLHIRVTMPWLFRGWFVQFWPLVVMGVAFLGIGVAEWCRRRGRRVLFEPLENTGALLPLLPALGYWMLPSRINYSLVLLAVGALYSALCVMRRSFLFGILATLAANGSLWYLLNSAEGLGILQHPQLWLIPPALCMLAAAYLNRSRLSAEQMTAVRYFAAIVIYASSTADIFINGVGQAPWLPLVLAGLSLLGIFAGILLRVQAFLYLGLSFLAISLFTMIWYAAVELERTWIWWVAGIVTGVLIIVMFGLFEKRRDEILRLAERVRQWEP